MTRKQKAVEAALLQKGFAQHDTDHSYFVYYTKEGKKTRAKTKTSHGKRELDNFLLGAMAKQVKLSKRDFIDLVDCPLDRDGYEAKAGDRL